jgi:hypothetical protein
MAYQVTQINDLEQFGELTTTFILTDDEGIMPEVRYEKFFSVKNNYLEFIEEEKQRDILRATNDYINSL